MEKLTDTEEYKRDMLIKKIEHAVETMRLSELEAVAYICGIYREILICFGIHEVVKVTVIVGILHILSLNVCNGELCRGIVALFNNGACDNVLDLGSYESGALARLYVLEFYYLKNISVLFKGYAVSEISGCYHKYDHPFNLLYVG